MRKRVGLVVLLLAVLVMAVVVARGNPAGTAPEWQAKVDPWVLDTAGEGETEFLVFLAEQADLSGAYALTTKLEKGNYVYETLTEVANRTQGPVITALQELGVAYQPYWVANMIWVRGNLNAIEAIAGRSDVAHLYANPTVHFEPPQVDLSQELWPNSPDAIEWNVLKINADDMWNLGYTGQGALIGGQDTGYDWDHPALINQYNGWNGSLADHNYSWHDAIHSGGGVCGANSTQPCDDNGHGTHTMGTMAGDDGGSNQIGVAPGARWIGCRNMDQGNGTPTTYSECYQWFIAPTDLAGNNPDPSKAPDVINNSWGCPTSEGCTDPNVMLSVVDAVRAAGILTSHSAGNSGPSCSTVNTPAGIYDSSFTIGATSNTDTIASFSSRGPVTFDGSGRMKPDISAPGVSVRSSLPGGSYGSLSGTSMASPHIAGVVALLISADPSLAGQVDALEWLMTQTAFTGVVVTPVQTCGGVPSTEIPNNTFGWGRVDVLAAHNAQTTPFSLGLNKVASADEVAVGEVFTYTLTVTNEHPLFATNNVMLSDTIPAGTTFVSASDGGALVGDTVEWSAATLAANQSWEVTLAVQVNSNAPSPVVNDTYSVSSDEVVTVAGSSVSTDVTPLALQISKSAAPEIGAGENLTYTITVTNPQEFATLNNVIIMDMLPAGTTFVSATGGGNLVGDHVHWHTVTLGPGAVWTVELVVNVPTTATGTVDNTDYHTESDEVGMVAGAIVSTTVIPLPTFTIYMPAIMND